MNGIVPFKGGQLQAAGVPKFWFGLAGTRSWPHGVRITITCDHTAASAP